jgi:hypothetical protein
MYVVIVTDGVALEYPPELYNSRPRATLEAERWAWILSGTGWLEVDRPFDGRWRVGGRDVRLLRVVTDGKRDSAHWIGQYWTADGMPDPEALLLGSRTDALTWVLEPPIGAGPAIETVDKPWFVSATYRFGDEEAYAVASLAKCITG